MLREDEIVIKRIRDFVKAQFGSSGDGLKLVGREREQFESLVEEIDRIRFSYAGETEPRSILLKEMS